jgi:hypothetical protein
MYHFNPTSLISPVKVYGGLVAKHYSLLEVVRLCKRHALAKQLSSFYLVHQKWYGKIVS